MSSEINDDECVDGDLTVGGFVSLVGAGPGDPELLTLKAVRSLERADLILYDALVNSDALEFAQGARRFCVGKRAQRPSFEQRTIEQLMIRSARRGERVVRLKCGDPYVLGRGGEEALALVEAGVPFEVIPGISSAVSAPALAGIPVTHRGISSGFLVVSGHSEETYGPILGGIRAHSVTLVVLMGMRASARIAEILQDDGWRPETPVAIVSGASTSSADTRITTLNELAEYQFEMKDPTAPGTLVIGDVVGLSEHLAPALTRDLESPRAIATAGLG